MRNRIFTFLRGLVNSDCEQAMANLSSPEEPDGQPWTADRLQQALDACHAKHEPICLDPNARNIRHTYVLPAEDQRTWRVEQMLVDPGEHSEWVAEFEVDARSRGARAAPGKTGKPDLIDFLSRTLLARPLPRRRVVRCTPEAPW